MTDRAPIPPARGRPEKAARPRLRRPSGAGVAILSIASFLAAGILLASQMLKGQDPALGTGEAPQGAAVERRVELTRVIEQPTAGTPAPSPVDASAPVPADPAPAPAPDPVSTGSS